MDKKELAFKREFLKLVKKYDCGLGYHLQDQIGEYEFNTRPPRRATHKSLEGIASSIEKFAKDYPNYKILPADDPNSLLVGYVVYTVVDKKEIARYFTVRLSDLAKARVRNPFTIMKEKFGVRLEEKPVA